MNQNIAVIKEIHSHFVGNRSYDDRLILSQKDHSYLSDEEMIILRDHFLEPFGPLENFFHFTHDVDLSLNEVYILLKRAFNNEASFLAVSQDLSKILLKRSVHPNIKTGDFHLVYFKDLIIDGEIVDGIGMFKTEEKSHFVVSNLDNDLSSFEIHRGVAKSRCDKGCLVFNFKDSDGYRAVIVDKTNRSKEASFWKETFLELKPINSEFKFTENYLTMCNAFVRQKLIDIDHVEKIDIVNKSLNYFKENEYLNRSSFIENVFTNQGVRASFESFEEKYSENEDVSIEDNFAISKQAVLKKSRSFRRILKLDNNFEILISGGNNMIEKGYDESSGRCFYKFYFDEEK